MLYLSNAITKQPGSFKIGIITVFLTVWIITFLESVLNVTPILFVQFGQKIGGAIDFTMEATVYESARIKGNVNYYAINQFESPFEP